MADPTSILTEAAHAASVASPSLTAQILPWLQTLLMPFVVVATAYAAWLVQRAILARRAAFDYIANHELHDEWQRLAAVALSRLAERSTKDEWAEIATAWSQAKLPEDDLEYIQPIFRWLNRREFISIGLLNGSIHQPTYADWWGIPFIREWERATPFIQALRSTDHGDEDLFRKFDELATSERFRQLAGWTPADSIHTEKTP